MDIKYQREKLDEVIEILQNISNCMVDAARLEESAKQTNNKQSTQLLCPKCGHDNIASMSDDHQMKCCLKCDHRWRV